MFLWPPGSASGFVRQWYGSEDPDPHPDPCQNVTSPLHHHKECIKKSSGSDINLTKVQRQYLKILNSVPYRYGSFLTVCNSKNNAQVP